MALISIKSLLEKAELASSDQFDEWSKAWRIATENGSQETLLGFFSRERGISEELFLQKLAEVLGWPFLDLRKVAVPTEARKRISTKVAFQYFVLPTAFEDGVLQVAVSQPFDTGMLGAVQYEARCPVRFALATKEEIEKALKKYYGVGAETLDEMQDEESIELLVEDKEITESDQEASVI